MVTVADLQQTGGVTLHKGNCLDVMRTMPDKCVDMILTDPPYGMGFQSGRRAVKYDKIVGDLDLTWVYRFVHEAYRVANDNTAHYVFASYHNIDIFKQAFGNCFTIKNILVWEKNNIGVGDLKGDFAPKVEFILFMHKGRRLINGKRDPNIMKFAKSNNKYHATQKPVDLCEYLITKFSNKGDTIMDPFMGSGTTGVACKNVGRNFVGIELDFENFATARWRIKEGVQ